MPARDRFHDVVRAALIKDGWTITHDPMVLHWGNRDLFVDLGAEQLLAAEKGSQKIAVEVKSFLRASDVVDLREALGQYTLYSDILAYNDPERVLYLAVQQIVLDGIFSEPIGALVLRRGVRLLAFSAEEEVITTWIT
jgi:hypothetical protein